MWYNIKRRAIKARTGTAYIARPRRILDRGTGKPFYGANPVVTNRRFFFLDPVSQPRSHGRQGHEAGDVEYAALRGECLFSGDCTDYPLLVKILPSPHVLEPSEPVMLEAELWKLYAGFG